MALPKRRHSRARRDKRRTHDALRRPPTSTCQECGRAKQPHRACAHCGTYRGRKVIAKGEEV